MKITKFFIDRPTLSNLLTVLIILVGLMSFFNLNRATYPTINFDVLRISTEYPGAATEDVEVNVTHKIEEELKEVQGIDRIRSVSFENLSLVYVFIDMDDPNPEQIKRDVRRAVDRVTDFPVEVRKSPEVSEIRSTNVAVIELGVVGQNVKESILREVALDLQDRIKEIHGVSSVEKVGYRDREVKILADPVEMQKRYVTLLDIVQAIKNRNIHTSGGTLASFKDSQKIVTFSEFEKIQDVEQVILRSNYTGGKVNIKQVATIEDGFAKPKILSRTNQKNSINLLIRSQGNADIINISEDIKDLIKKLKGHLPKGVELVIVSDFSYYTKSLLNIVKNNALIGIILVIIVLMIFLTKVTAFWTALGIPMSVLGAMIFFPLFGININFISMITLILVLGLLVDDAIVISENITRHLEMGKTKAEAALIGSKEMFWPVTTTVATSILAFIPMFYMTGVTGKFIQQIPMVVILTLLWSLFESTCLLPAHICHGPDTSPKEIHWFNKVKDFYNKIVKWTLERRAITLTMFAGFLVVAGLLLTFKMKLILFPYDDVDIFYVIAEFEEGTPIELANLKMRPVEDIVAKIPKDELVGFNTVVGHHDTNVYGATGGLHENWAMVKIYLEHAALRDRNSLVIMSELEEKFQNLKGFKKLYTQKFNDGPPVGKPITISIVSKKDDLRKNFTNEIYDYLKTIPGVLNLETDERWGKKELRVKPDHEHMARLGITSFQLSQILRAAFQGIVPTSITREGEQIDYRVKLHTGTNVVPKSIIEKLQVANPRGQLIDIGKFVKFEEKKSLELVRHYNGRRSITITGDVDENLTTSSTIKNLVFNKFNRSAETNPSLKLVFGGEEKATQESMESFLRAFVVALLAIYFILILLFDSWSQPFIIMTAIPFGFAGVVIVFFLHGMSLSFMGMIGCLGLLGIVVNDSLIMVSHLNALSKSHKLDYNLILRGSKDRLRAVLLTTITTVAGTIPTVYGFGGSEPFIVPVVMSIAGGLIFATFITLILVPILYSFRVKKENQVFA